MSPPRTTTTTPGIHEIRHPSRPTPPSSSTVPGPPPRPSCTGNDCHYDGRAAERAGRKEMGCVGQRGTRGHRRACTVKSILTGAHADPHSYQASPADAAAIVDAELVIYNGGGYDPWVDQVLAGHPGVQAVDAYSLLGAVGDDDAPNEHVFYDPMSPRRSRQRSPTGWRTSTRPIPGTIERTPPSSAAAPTQSQFPNTRSPPPIPTPRSSRPNPSCTTCWRQPA